MSVPADSPSRELGLEPILPVVGTAPPNERERGEVGELARRRFGDHGLTADEPTNPDAEGLERGDVLRQGRAHELHEVHVPGGGDGRAVEVRRHDERVEARAAHVDLRRGDAWTAPPVAGIDHRVAEPVVVAPRDDPRRRAVELDVAQVADRAVGVEEDETVLDEEVAAVSLEHGRLVRGRDRRRRQRGKGEEQGEAHHGCRLGLSVIERAFRRRPRAELETAVSDGRGGRPVPSPSRVPAGAAGARVVARERPRSVGYFACYRR